MTTSAGRSRASRIALVVAGHLRELCSTDANFDASPWSLVQTVRASSARKSLLLLGSVELSTESQISREE